MMGCIKERNGNSITYSSKGKKHFQKLISQITLLPLFIINALFLLFSLPNKKGALCSGKQ